MDAADDDTIRRAADAAALRCLDEQTADDDSTSAAVAEAGQAWATCVVPAQAAAATEFERLGGQLVDDPGLDPNADARPIFAADGYLCILEPAPLDLCGPILERITGTTGD